jgi:glycerol-3-phosphate acyltransferase PlsY
MMDAAIAIVVAYALGAMPVAYLAGRLSAGVDLRRAGSGNVGASNVWQTAGRWLVVPVGLAQIGQGAAAVLIARATDGGDGIEVACAAACVIANNWNPLLRFTGGRGIGTTIGALIVLSPAALAAFAAIAVAGVGLRAVPQCVAGGLLATPVAAAVAGDGVAVAGGCAVLAVLALIKRATANELPDPAAARPQVWLNRLYYDRDIRDRDAWVRRGASR